MASCPYLNSSMMLSKPKHPTASFCPLDFPNSQHLSSSLSFIASPIGGVKSVSRRCRQTNQRCSLILASMDNPKKPLKIMISGAPASGKGTQCELITSKYDLVHVAAGDLLRAEVAAGSENGKQAKEYMEKGQLVPDKIVVMMVKDRLSQPDSNEKGWLLDGYPRSSSQATALQAFGFQPDLFILLEVPEEILVDRVVGRRLDPVTGRIYHLTYSPPETEEIAARLTQRFDDTEERVKLRLQTHNQNVESVLSLFEDITVKVDGSLPKEDVFAKIDSALSNLIEQKNTTMLAT
ncbi:hypothetical protein L6452_38724 [Arctium lappa]|uniref:Uncharacterized protein n=1 Tax=Arctium lappa TaxID=4217 RepID=A0ACB8XQC1_ARCLA|nr:hypothetical protein L6452_38724 [Arctium lappa]